MRNVSGKKTVQKIKTNILFSITFFFENRAYYEIMWKNTAKPGIRFTCSVPNSANKQSEYVTTIAFPLQQWLHERASMLRYITLPALIRMQQPVFPSASFPSSMGHDNSKPLQGYP